jgi:hypothetical protein
MNYCSLQDAWGDTNYISDQYKKYDANIDNAHIDTNTKQIETFEEAPVNEPTVLYPTNTVYDYSSKLSCDDIIAHMEKCQHCRQKMMRRFSPNLTVTLKNYINKNKDIVLIVLVSLFIVILFNLLVSLFFR